MPYEVRFSTTARWVLIGLHSVCLIVLLSGLARILKSPESANPVLIGLRVLFFLVVTSALLEALLFSVRFSALGIRHRDNARAESFMKTLKSEEVSLKRYRDLAEARASIEHFLEQIYNRRRLHSALGYVPPVEFEAAVASSGRREPGRVRYGFSQA